MRLIKSVVAFFAMLWGGLSGGQGKQAGKAPRRFGVPAFAIGFGLSIKWSWKYLAFLLFVPILSLGYGVDSQLGSFCGHIEWLIRLVYALLLSLPFYIFGLWRGVIASLLLCSAFQVYAGSLGNISWLGDILIEDICRYSVLAGLVIFNVLFNKD